MAQKGIASSKRVTVSIVRRALLAPEPGSAEARHAYTTVFTARAEVRSRLGASEWGQIEIDGKKASHTFTLRYTTIPFDARDRVRDVTGQLWSILSVEHDALGRREMRLHCATVGNEDVPAAR